MGGRSKSSSSKTSNVTDQRVGVSSGEGSLAVGASGGARVNVNVTVTDVSPEIVNAALRELTDLGEFTIEEAFEFAGRAGKEAFEFAGGAERQAAQVQKEALRIVESVIEREQEPGVSSARAALLAGVAVVGLVAFSGGFR